MDWNLIIKLAGPMLIQLAQNTITDLGTPKPEPVIAHPSEAIKSLQLFLNTALVLNPPLVADGWLGPKTEQAIFDGITKLKALGVG